MKIDCGFAEDVIKTALKKGADQAEIFIKSTRNLSVEVKGQSLDSLNSSDGFGYALRVFKKGRLGFSYSTDKDDRDSVVKNAVESAEFPDVEIFHDLPDASDMAEVSIFDPSLIDMLEDAAIRKVMLMERTAHEEDQRIKKVRKASGSFTSSETLIVNSKGLKAGYPSSSCTAQIMAVAETGGESQMGWDFEGSRFISDVSFEEVGKNAARNALRLLGSRKIQGQRAPVILDSSVTVDFLGIFASSLSAEAVLKGKSLLAGKTGRKVISDKINIIDSGLISGRLGSSPVDDEGVPVQEKTLIREGRLQTYIHNTYTAKKTGTTSTGNAVRGGTFSLPVVGISNLFIGNVPGARRETKEGLFRLAGSGLYVVDAMGVHTANPISGDFSVGVTGLWLEGGEVVYPVKEAVISGNVLDFFSRVEAFGDDLRFYGNIGAPSLIISDIDISA
ncbi:MAG: TldD/PmbA family protein [Nitrospirae bacterium]|nr:TldD/PmbA family protein [Nitrospirota bacterium]